MTPDNIRGWVEQALLEVAPELSPQRLRSGEPLRDQAELDSMDFLRFVIELAKRSGVEVPEADYPQLATIDDIVRYVSARRSGAERSCGPDAPSREGERSVAAGWDRGA